MGGGFGFEPGGGGGPVLHGGDEVLPLRVAEGVGHEAAARAAGVAAAGEEAQGLQPVQIPPDHVAAEGLAPSAAEESDGVWTGAWSLLAASILNGGRAAWMDAGRSAGAPWAVPPDADRSVRAPFGPGASAPGGSVQSGGRAA